MSPWCIIRWKLAFWISKCKYSMILTAQRPSSVINMPSLIMVFRHVLTPLTLYVRKWRSRSLFKLYYWVIWSRSSSTFPQELFVGEYATQDTKRKLSLRVISDVHPVKGWLRCEIGISPRLLPMVWNKPYLLLPSPVVASYCSQI